MPRRRPRRSPAPGAASSRAGARPARRRSPADAGRRRHRPPCGALGRVNAPAGVRRDYPLARLTTIRTGGPADWFARPGSVEQLLELLRWADAQTIEVGVVGSGSNLLVRDGGFRGLVLKLDEELAKIEQEGDHMLCGG